ncbi:MAG: ribonuclease III [Kiritimatiellae bacterium]|nr:ribonuclease III [Kiritimatiellia bacterium]
MNSETSAVAAAFGHAFADPALLETALTHPSRAEENPGTADNQRLEFLGDAVLGFLLADRVYRDGADRPEGDLTRRRAAIASGPALAAKAREIGLGAALRLGRGEAKTGGADRASNLEDAMEALFGAVYLDGGLGAARAALEKLFAAELAALPSLGEWSDNPRGQLQALAQARFGAAPDYGPVASSGPLHEPVFEATVRAGGLEASGSGPSKHAAQAAAAAALLARLDAPGGLRGRGAIV